MRQVDGVIGSQDAVAVPMKVTRAFPIGTSEKRKLCQRFASVKPGFEDIKPV